MITVEVNFTTTATDRAKAVACLTEQEPQMRALPGNLGSKTLIDPNDENAVTLLHQWDDLESFDAYRNGPLLAAIGATLRPMMTSPPSTTVYQAEPLG